MVVGSRGASSPLGPLVHPVFLAALLLLLLNDHFLKGGALLPGWLTGKLSDFAGLIVAPVLSATPIPRRFPRLRVLAFLSPVLLFACINLSPGLALVWDTALSMTGMSCRSVSDPTDLVAFSSLPLAGWLAFARPAHRGTVRGRGTSTGVLVLERAIAGVALLACIATTAPEEPSFASAWLYNATQVKLRIRIQTFTGDWPCEETVIDPESLLVDSAFDAPHTTTLEPLEDIVLDSHYSGPSPEKHPRCGAALLEIPGLPRTLVTWTELDAINTAKRSLNSNHSVRIEGLETARGLSSSNHFEIREFASNTTFANCSLDSGTAVGWSPAGALEAGDWSPAGTLETDRLIAIDEEDGCPVLRFSGVDSLLRLCVPPELIPFEVGETLVSEVTETGLVLESEDGSARWEQIAGSADELPIAELSLELSDCDPQPRDCGGLEIPGMLRLGERTVAPGETIAWPDANSNAARLYLARASHVLSASSSCRDFDAALGGVAELVIVEQSE